MRKNRSQELLSVLRPLWGLHLISAVQDGFSSGSQFPGEWCLNKLTSLEDLNVGDFDLDMTPFPEDSTIPRTLVHLRVQSLPNLRFLSKGLHNLIFLEVLDVWDCPKLQFLPKDGLPIMLGVLHIRNCPLLENQCLDEKDWILRWTAKTEVPIPPTVQPDCWFEHLCS
ncbi:hypothetical protein QQP08_002974 [Theobroma cacao]|nr:hypothetical protein QQP08_002974 [Theobroma cacao]